MFKTFGHHITGICKTTDVMFDNIKALKSNWKFLIMLQTMALLNVSQTHKKHMTDLEMHDKPFRDFKCNFQVSLIQLSNHSLTPLVISRYCKIHKMCSVILEKMEFAKVAVDWSEWVWEACDLGSSWIKTQYFCQFKSCTRKYWKKSYQYYK